jgi:hypothetical protein
MLFSPHNICKLICSQQSSNNYPLLAFSNTHFPHIFFCFLLLQILHKYFLLCLCDWKRNTWAELPNIITVHCTLVYWCLDNVIGCYIVVPRHWHPSCLHRYPATNTNPASCTLFQEREVLIFNAKRYIKVNLMRIKYAKYLLMSR